MCQPIILHRKETVACDGFLAYLVPSRMQRRDLNPFPFCSKIRRDRHKFISFAVFSETLNLIRRLLPWRSVSLGAF
jgi:hypothetical protein